MTPGPTPSSRSYGYEMPPTLLHALVTGSTWALLCPGCDRRVAVNVIDLVARHDVYTFKSEPMLRRAVCKACGAKMRHVGGYQVGALQHIGRLPRLITADGSSWRWPGWEPATD